MSAGLRRPFCWSRTSTPASEYPTCRFTTHHPWQEDVELCQLHYRNTLFVTEIDTFQLAISLRTHCLIQAKPSCEHDRNSLSTQSGIPKCASTADQDRLVTSGLTQWHTLMTSLSQDALPSHFPQRPWIQSRCHQSDLNI